MEQNTKGHILNQLKNKLSYVAIKANPTIQIPLPTFEQQQEKGNLKQEAHHFKTPIHNKLQRIKLKEEIFQSAAIQYDSDPFFIYKENDIAFSKKDNNQNQTQFKPEKPFFTQKSQQILPNKNNFNNAPIIETINEEQLNKPIATLINYTNNSNTMDIEPTKDPNNIDGLESNKQPNERTNQNISMIQRQLEKMQDPEQMKGKPIKFFDPFDETENCHNLMFQYDQLLTKPFSEILISDENLIFDGIKHRYHLDCNEALVQQYILKEAKNQEENVTQIICGEQQQLGMFDNVQLEMQEFLQAPNQDDMFSLLNISHNLNLNQNTHQ